MHALEELLYAAVDWIFGVPMMVSTQYSVVQCRQTYLFMIFTSSALVVRSIDLMMTLFLGVMGELASFKGLKLKTLFKILFAAFGRRWINMPKLFNVAVTSNPSLVWVRCVSAACDCLSNL